MSKLLVFLLVKIFKDGDWQNKLSVWVIGLLFFLQMISRDWWKSLRMSNLAQRWRSTWTMLAVRFMEKFLWVCIEVCRCLLTWVFHVCDCYVMFHCCLYCWLCYLPVTCLFHRNKSSTITLSVFKVGIPLELQAFLRKYRNHDAQWPPTLIMLER